MAFGYPISLELAGKHAVVIGTDAVRQGKVDSLLAAGADILVVAEEPEDALLRLEASGAAKVARRGYERGDLLGAFVCIASSEDAAEREAIWAESREEGVLTNIMDDIPHCDWAAPAVVRRGDLVIAIATGGKSPALAKRLRHDLGEQFGREWEEALGVVDTVRRETLPQLPDLTDRSRRWNEALDIDELLELVRDGQADEAGKRLRSRLLEGLE
jgi:siroheme synthase-like protein